VQSLAFLAFDIFQIFFLLSVRNFPWVLFYGRRCTVADYQNGPIIMLFLDLIGNGRHPLARRCPSLPLRGCPWRNCLIEALEARVVLSAPPVPAGLVDVISNNLPNATPIPDSSFKKDLKGIANNSVDGVAFQIDWKDIQTTTTTTTVVKQISQLPGEPPVIHFVTKTVSVEGPTDWSRLNALFTAADNAGKWVQLLVFPGFWTPGWVLNDPAVQKGVFDVQYGQQDNGKMLPLPFPYATNTVYFDDWYAFLGQLRDRYENDLGFRMIAAAGPTSVSDEFTEPDQDSTTVHDTQEWITDGFIPTNYNTAWQDVFSIYNADFPKQYVSLSVGQGLPTINADGSAVSGSPADQAQEMAVNAANTRTALTGEASSTLIDFNNQFVYQCSSLTGNPAAQSAGVQSSQLSLIDQNGTVDTGFQLGSSCETASSKQGAAGNPALAMALSIENGMDLNTNGQHVSYIEVHAEDVNDIKDTAMQAVLGWGKSLFDDPGTLSLFDQTADDYSITVDNSGTDPEVLINGEFIRFPQDQIGSPPASITSINLYPEIFVEGSHAKTVEADNTVDSTDIPITIADVPGTSYGKKGFNFSKDNITLGQDPDGVAGVIAPVTLTNSSPPANLSVEDTENSGEQIYTLSDTTLTCSDAALITFSKSISSVVIHGSSLGNSFVVPAKPEFSVTLNGGVGSNSLTGPDVASVWTINGSNAGTLNTRVNFSSVANLVGGNAGNSFSFNKAAMLTGTIDGGADADQLNYSAYGTGVYVNFLSGTATGTNGITNIEQVNGSNLDDVLVGTGADATLTEKSGDNLIIGGADGGSLLHSGSGQDIVIAGSTTYDDDQAALMAIENFWATNHGPLAARVAALTSGISGNQPGVTYQLTANSVLPPSGAGDIIDLSSKEDWLFWRGPSVDKLSGKKPGAVLRF
jgi:hypothetical protein